MSTNLAQLTAAPLEFTANGKTYLLSPLSDAEFGRLLAWIQDKILAVAKKAIVGLSDDMQKDLMRHAFDRVSRIQLTSQEASDYLVSLEGGIQIAWLSLQKRQPQITREEVVEIMSDPELAPALMAKIDALRELHSVRPFPVEKTTKKERQALRRKPTPLKGRPTSS